MEPTLTTSSASNRSLLSLSLCLSAGLAGLSVAITGPILVDIAHTHQISVALAGQLMTLGSLAGMVSTPALFAALAVGHGATVGITDVGLNSLVVASDPTSRGSVAALRSVMDSLGGFVGPALDGAVIAGSGYPAAGWLIAVAALAAAGTITVGARSRETAVEPKVTADMGGV